MDRRTRWIAAATAAAVAIGCLLAWWLLRDDSEQPERMAGPAPTVEEPAIHSFPPVKGECSREATRPFTPEQITVVGVVEGADVIGVPRDSRGVTGVLPESDKVDFAWDLGGTRPGSRRGNVLLNTHTWPDGSALGNALLADLDVGDRIVVHGQDSRLCYRVNLRIEVPVEHGYAPYYDAGGPPRVAIIVCSGTRSSAGEWSHRTIWFARPIT